MPDDSAQNLIFSEDDDEANRPPPTSEELQLERWSELQRPPINTPGARFRAGEGVVPSLAGTGSLPTPSALEDGLANVPSSILPPWRASAPLAEEDQTGQPLPTEPTAAHQQIEQEALPERVSAQAASPSLRVPTQPLEPPVAPQPLEQLDSPRAFTRPLPGATRRAPTQPMLRRAAPPAPAPLPTEPSPNAARRLRWARFRRQSCWFLPAVLVAVFFSLVAVVSVHQAAALAPSAILPLLLIFAGLGVLHAGVLFFTSAYESAWAVGVLGGLVVYLGVTFWAVFGFVFGSVLGILLVVLFGVMLRERSYPVKAGTVVVMGRFGKPTRILSPGFNLRAPGEQSLGVVEQDRQRYEVKMPPLLLTSGEEITLGVALTYQAIAGEEHLAVRTTKDWHLPVQQRLVAVVEDVVSTLSGDDFRALPGSRPVRQRVPDMPDEEELPPSPLARINDALTRTMCAQIAERGVMAHAVSVHVLAGPRAPGGASTQARPFVAPHPTVALSGAPATVGRVVEGSLQSPASPAVPSPWTLNAPGLTVAPAGTARSGGAGGTNRTPPVPVLPVAAPAGGGAAPPSASVALPLLNAQQLVQTYEDIRYQRLTNTAIINGVIEQFEAIAADPVLRGQVQFDAAVSAQYLRDHLRYLERQAAFRSASAPFSAETPISEASS